MARKESVKKEAKKDVKKQPKTTERPVHKNGKLIDIKNPVIKKKPEPIEEDDEIEQKPLKDLFEDEDQDEDNEDIDLFDSGEEDDDDSSDSDEDEVEASPQNLQGKEKDIFTDVGEKSVRKGVPVYYQIVKNGSMLSRKDHPYSWELLQSEFGGGYYKVTAKNAITHVIMGWDGKSVLDPMGFKKEADKEKPEIPAPQNPYPQQAPQPQLDVNSLLTTIMTVVGGHNKAQAGAEVANTNAITQLIGQMQQNNMTFMQQSNQQFMTMMDKMSQQNTEMFKAVQAQIEKLSNKPVDKAMGPLELITLLEKSKKDGVEQWTNLMKMAKSEAEDKKEIISAMKEIMEDGKEGQGNKGVVDKLLEGLLPMLAQVAIASKAQGSPQPVIDEQVQALAVAQEAATHQEQVRQAPRPQVLRPPMPQGPRRVVKERTTPVTENETKTKIIDLMTPHVAKWLSSREAPQLAATQGKVILQNAGWAMPTVVQNFKVDDLYALRRKYGIPPVADKWLTAFYEALVADEKPVEVNASSPTSGAV